MTLRINSRPDAYGWIYGDYITPIGEAIRVNIMPPVDHWDGDRRARRGLAACRRGMTPCGDWRSR